MKKPLTNRQLMGRALALCQASQTINKTLALVNDRENSPLSEQRVAELQACAVIIRRAEGDFMDVAYPQS